LLVGDRREFKEGMHLDSHGNILSGHRWLRKKGGARTKTEGERLLLQSVSRAEGADVGGWSQETGPRENRVTSFTGGERMLEGRSRSEMKKHLR